jgi:FHS family L-fucose permease-like MFS transporter
MNGGEQSAAPRYHTMLFIVVSLFFLWGVANNLNDVLIAQFKKAFSLSDLQSGLVQSAFYMGYFLLAIPASLFVRRYGYKAAVVFGLCLYCVGALLFYPAAELREYSFFLAALFVIASGLAFLETSANPLMTMLGSPETAERRLNFAQAFNPLGSITGVLIGRHFIFSGVEHNQESLAGLAPDQLAAFYAHEAQAVQMPYLVLGGLVLAWAVVVAVTRFSQVATAASAPAESGATLAGFRELLRKRRFVFGVVAQFFYVGAQVGIWSFMIRYAQHADGGIGEKAAASVLVWSLVGFMLGRFAGTALMLRYNAGRLMAAFAGINIMLCLVAVVFGGMPGLMALAATSFFMSIMFPTIFAMALKNLGPLTPSGSSLLVMAIIGGAILPALMGGVSDLSSIRVAMLLPAACFAVVGAFALARGSRAADMRLAQAAC